MRQVPEYAIIGGGRVARHFSYYFSLLDIPFTTWTRDADTALESVVRDCKRVLLLISDSAIASFITAHECLQNKYLVHFSGALTIEGVIGAHPLMSFAEEYYSLNDYKNIPFILDSENTCFNDIFPQLSNVHYHIPPDKKAYYHSLCVASGNFSTILWQKMFSALEQQLAIPKQAAFPYLKQICRNLISDSDTALTGPLLRKDRETIDANMNALTNDPLQIIYQAFITTFKEMHT